MLGSYDRNGCRDEAFDWPEEEERIAVSRDVETGRVERGERCKSAAQTAKHVK